MKISVVIPAYNCEKWISRAIESVLNQSRPADEVIVINDGSTDGTEEVVRSFGNAVILIQQDNAGVSAARNAGIKAARGDWIAFLDADDEWMPDYLKQQCELLARNPELVWSTANFYFCYCDEKNRIEKYDSSKRKEILAGREYFEDYCEAYADHACGWTGTMLIHKKVFEEAGLFKPGLPMGEDQDLWFRIAFVYPKVGYLPEALAVYHMHMTDSATQKFTLPEYLIVLLDRLLQLAREHNCLERFEPCARQLLKYYLDKYLHDDRIRSIPLLLNKFGYLLSRRSRMILRALSLWPQATVFLLPLISRLNKRLRLKL